MEVELTEAQKIKVANTDQVFAIMQDVLKREQYLDLGKEHLWVIGMENNNRLLFIELISLGCVTETTIHPPDVFRVAILKNATKMIVCHNHPSGEIEPSQPDIDHTDKLIQMGKYLRVEVVDHMIFCTESFYSFAKEGLFQQLKQSTKWLPSEKLREQLERDYTVLREMAREEGKEEGIEIGLDIGLEKGLKVGDQKAIIMRTEGIEKGLKMGEERGTLKGKKEMAKALKQKGVEISIISETSGLTTEQINKL